MSESEQQRESTDKPLGDAGSGASGGGSIGNTPGPGSATGGDQSRACANRMRVKSNRRIVVWINIRIRRRKCRMARAMRRKSLERAVWTHKMPISPIRRTSIPNRSDANEML